MSKGGSRGRVTQAPKRSIRRSGGRLSRAQIARVVAAGIPDVQRCYERQLVDDSGLQGKIVFDWVISTTGGVSSTRVRSSSLKSQAVAGCTSRVIKGWKFPEPVGGTVQVTYPFVFRVRGL